jgi:hypothetical protein
VNSWPLAPCSHAKGERPLFQTSTGLDSRYTTCGSRRPPVNTHTPHRIVVATRNSQGIFLLLVVFLLWLQDSHACLLGLGERVLELRPVLDKVTIRRPWSFVVPENTKKTHGWIYLFILKKRDLEFCSPFLVGMPCRDAGRQAGGGGAPPPRRRQPSHRSAPPHPHRCGSRRKDARPSWSGGCARVVGCARMCHARLQMHTTYGNGRKEKRPCLSVVRL